MIPNATTPRIDFNTVAPWAQSNASSILKKYGVVLGKDGRGPCVLHGGKNPNFKLSANGIWTCYSACGVSDNVAGFVRRLNHGSLPEREGRVAALRELGEMMAGSPLPMTAPSKPTATPKPVDELEALRADGMVPSLPPAIYTAILNELGLGPLGCEYLDGRGFDPDIARLDGFRSIESPKEWSDLKAFLMDSWLPAELRAAGLAQAPWRGSTPALVLPYGLAGTIYGLRFRSLRSDAAHKDRYRDLLGASVPIPFNSDAFAGKGNLWVSEGELNAYTLKMKGLRAVGVPGAGRFRHEWLPLITAAVRKPDVLVAWWDTDAAGKNGFQKFARWLPRNMGTLVVESGEDANELHIRGELEKTIAQVESHQ